MAVQESEGQRVNRELLELLGELRVALPGVQVLFAFLLAVPFQARFADATTFQRDVYFATLVLSALASVLLIAPSALHRLNFRTVDKRRIVFLSNSLAVWGAARARPRDDRGDAADRRRAVQPGGGPGHSRRRRRRLRFLLVAAAGQ